MNLNSLFEKKKNKGNFPLFEIFPKPPLNNFKHKHIVKRSKMWLKMKRNRK